MRTELRSRGEAFVGEAQAEIAKYLEALRGTMAQRLDGIDTKEVRRRADRVSERFSEAITDAIVDGIDTVRDRVRPRPRPRPPVALIVLGGIAAGAGIAAFILGRRPDVRARFTELTGQAQRQIPLVVAKARGGGGNGHSASQEESALQKAVEKAIFTDTPAGGDLRVDVEGRTVYLRGRLDDRVYVDAAVQKAQAVEGVAAVINLVSA